MSKLVPIQPAVFIDKRVWKIRKHLSRDTIVRALLKEVPGGSKSDEDRFEENTCARVDIFPIDEAKDTAFGDVVFRLYHHDGTVEERTYELETASVTHVYFSAETSNHRHDRLTAARVNKSLLPS